MDEINKNIHEMMQELKIEESEVTTDAEQESTSIRTYTGSSNMTETMGGQKGIKADWKNKVDKDEIAPKDDACCRLF